MLLKVMELQELKNDVWESVASDIFVCEKCRFDRQHVVYSEIEEKDLDDSECEYDGHV
jgi:hypothetical protein